MKNFTLAVVVGFTLVLSSVSAQAASWQLIDCSSDQSWDKLIITLQTETEYKSGTLFLSSGAESDEDSGVMELQEVATSATPEFRVYQANNSIASFTAVIPSAVIGKRSDRFEVNIALSRTDGVNAGADLVCWSRMHSY